MDEREAQVAQTARTHNIARNRRLLRVLCFTHVLCGRGFIGAGATARRRAAWWNEPVDEGEPAPVHALPCALEIPVRGSWRDVTDVCGPELDAPHEFEDDEGLVTVFHETDALLEGFDEPIGLCRAFEAAADRMIRDRRVSPSFRPDPRAVENAFRRYRMSALDALAEARHTIGSPGETGADDAGDEGWPEKGSDAFRRLQLAVLDGYLATLVSPGVGWALVGDVQAFVNARFRT